MRPPLLHSTRLEPPLEFINVGVAKIGVRVYLPKSIVCPMVEFLYIRCLGIPNLAVKVLGKHLFLSIIYCFLNLQFTQFWMSLSLVPLKDNFVMLCSSPH